MKNKNKPLTITAENIIVTIHTGGGYFSEIKLSELMPLILDELQVKLKHNYAQESHCVLEKK
jgi:hypothetical protein